MSDEYGFGMEREFQAAATVPPSESLEPATAVARDKAYELAQAWGLRCTRRICLFRFYESWEVKERGGTWVLTFALRVRVVSIEESLTLPGQWSYNANEGFLNEASDE